jgi:hypothetical protein
MNQPTSIQMLDAAIWQELGGEKAHDAEAVYHTLGTLLSRWLLARSESRNGGDQAFCKGPGVCRPTGAFLCNRASQGMGLSNLMGLLAAFVPRPISGMVEEKAAVEVETQLQA